MAYTTLSNKIIFVCKEQVAVNDITAWKCFPVNKGSDKIMETALIWARGYNEEIDVKMFEYDNIEFDDVTITNLEIRSEGGRAYKVLVKVDNNYFYVDLRESCLMDTIKTQGIEAGGKLKGKYIFIQEGSNMKLTLIDSKAHKEAVENEKKKQIKKIANSALIPGHVYQNLSGERALFLGTVYNKSFKIKNNSNRYEIVEGKVDKKLIFITTYSYNNLTMKEINEKLDSGYLYNFKFQSSHTFREDHGSLEKIDCESAINRLIDIGKKESIKFVNNYTKKRFGIFSYDKDQFEECLMYYHLSKFKNIEINTELIEKIKKLL